MKKILIYGLLLSVTLLFSACNDKKNTNTMSEAKFSDIKVGNKLVDFTLDDQFDKKHSLTDETKKVIFVCSKPAGHIVREYLKAQSVDYLPSRHIIFIADVSGMPSLIYKMFALPDFKDSPYSILLILKKENASKFRNEKRKDDIMVLSLDHKTITKIEYFNNEKDFVKAID